MSLDNRSFLLFVLTEDAIASVSEHFVENSIYDCVNDIVDEVQTVECFKNDKGLWIKICPCKNPDIRNDKKGGQYKP